MPLRRPYLSFVFVRQSTNFGKCGPPSTKFSAKRTQEKKKKKKEVKPRDEHVEHVCKISASTLKIGMDIRSFVRKNEEDTLFPSNYLVLA